MKSENSIRILQRIVGILARHRLEVFNLDVKEEKPHQVKTLSLTPIPENIAKHLLYRFLIETDEKMTIKLMHEFKQVIDLADVEVSSPKTVIDLPDVEVSDPTTVTS